MLFHESKECTNQPENTRFGAPIWNNSARRTLINVGGRRVPLTGYESSMGFEHYHPGRLGAQHALLNGEIEQAFQNHLAR